MADNPDLEIVGFHRIDELKTLQFLCRERKSLNLGFSVFFNLYFSDPASAHSK